MKPTQTVQLVRLIAQIWPSMRINEHTPDAWHPLLEDLDFDAAVQAVKDVAKVSSAYIAPADIRRQVAASAGLLAPSEDVAWQQAVDVALAEGIGRSRLHPAVAQAYANVGAAPGIRQGQPGPTRAAFITAYRQIRETHERHVLAGDLAHEHLALAVAGPSDITPYEH